MFRTAAAAVGHDPRTAAGAVRTDSPYSTECWNEFLGGIFEMKSRVLKFIHTEWPRAWDLCKNAYRMSYLGFGTLVKMHTC